MTEPELMCACGKPLHYRRPELRAMIERFVRELGPDVRVRVGARTWLVPRHYIALHGIRGRDLPWLGFPEVTE